ncbi:MAG: bifunctional folylpolyglutamate synthase/dihydrofolate synthase [Firmicutes bacterium]|nr:bifunctional folylpolyglutamate synthase/dihydrofolate synthase [Bacillota bacterium]
MDKNIIERIHGFDRFGIVLGMERLEELLRRLGDPQDGLRCIHVAGTNGKGSVCKFLESGLAACGYKVGLYISPFIEVFNERIQYDGRYITDEELDRYGWQAVKAAEDMVADGLVSPTEFEVVMAIAFLFYRDVQPDIVILECGMGGEGDATNIIRNPLACIFTSVSYDHMQVLGDTLEKIAATKAGIIKDGAPVISNVKDHGPAAVIARTAYQKGSRLYDVSKIRTSVDWESPVSQQVSMQLMETDYSEIEISMAGRHQAENLKTALACIEVLRRSRRIQVERSRLYEGLKNAVQPGRFEVVLGREEWEREGRFAPMVVLDGAHNEAGAQALQETMQRLFEGRKILLVTGILADKEVDAILDQFTKITDRILVTEPESPRRLPADQMAEKLRKRGIPPVEVTENAEDGLAAAEEIWNEYEVVLFAGSLYLIGAIRRLIRNGASGRETAAKKENTTVL